MTSTMTRGSKRFRASSPRTEVVESNSPFPLPGTPHPLLLYGIVSDVFRCLPSSDLRISRLVCKMWQDEASKVLRKRRCKIHLSSTAVTKEYMQLQQNEVYPLFVKVGTCFGKKNPVIHSFIRKFGHRIISLELCHPSWTTFIYLRKFLGTHICNLENLNLSLVPPEKSYSYPNSQIDSPNFDVTCLKNLKTLHLHVDHDKYWSMVDQTNVKLFLNHFLSGMPNLETISCPPYPENFIETFQYEVQVLFRESPNLRPLISLLTESTGVQFPKLKHLNIPLKVWVNVPSLQERNYKLETLDWFIGLDVKSHHIHNFLYQVAGTLKTLSLDFTTAGQFMRDPNFQPSDLIPSSHFSKLDTLTLRSFKGTIGLIFDVPTLRHLSLTKARDLSSTFDPGVFTKEAKHTSLVSLVIDQHNPKDAVRPGTVARIGNTFPNLRKLEIRFLSDSSLRSVFEFCPHLEEVIAHDGIFTDAGVTGISIEHLEQVSENKMGVPFKKIAKFREFLYIGSLKNLKKLDIRSKHLTGDSVYLGILNCCNLTSLTIMGYGFSNISLCAIADELNLSFFKTIYCHQLTVAGGDYIRTRLRHCELQLNELQKPLNGLDIYRLGLFQSGTVPIQRRRTPLLSDTDTCPRPYRQGRRRLPARSSNQI